MRHLPCGLSFSCPAHNLGRTNKKPFTELIGLIHFTIRRAVTCQSWVTRCSPRLPVFRPGIYIFRFIIVTIWCLLESKGPIYGIGRETEYLSFSWKNFEASGDFLYHETAYVRTLPFWMGGSPFERTAPVFPFLPEICRFEKILA